MNRARDGDERQEDGSDRKLTAKELMFRRQRRQQEDAKSGESYEDSDEPKKGDDDKNGHNHVGAPDPVTDTTTLSSKPSPSNTPSSSGLKLVATRPCMSTRKAQSLDELEASAESVRKKGLNIEEQHREMGIIYSRRKRVRQKLRIESLEEKKNSLMEENARLGRENAKFETLLRNAQAQVNVVERRLEAMSAYGTMNVAPHPPLGGIGWNMPSAARVPFPHSMAFMHQAAQNPSFGQQRPLYLPGPGAASAISPMNFYGVAANANNARRPSVLSPARAGPSPATGSGGGSHAAAAAQAGGLAGPSLHLVGINPMLLQMHFLGQVVIPGVEERLNAVPVSELQELRHYWSLTLPDAAAHFDDYLRRRLHQRW